MKKFVVLLTMLICIITVYSCNNSGKQNKSEKQNISVQNKILQQKDGTISLKVDNAECYQDMVNPASNTAEWNVVVSKSGRFNVWLSSATRDTTNLKYQNKVMLSILDNRLETQPECDKIIHNSTDVSYPYFRADSYMGSLYIQDTGLYNIQVISDKIVPKNYNNDKNSSADDSKLISVSLTPITR
jgi:hypothetical protein